MRATILLANYKIFRDQKESIVCQYHVIGCQTHGRIQDAATMPRRQNNQAPVKIAIP